MKAAKKSKESKSKWAWLRLGMLHLKLGDANEAVVALQSAIRTDYSDW
jgi:cytochrome c-type biogenesis protein CcmH/NrfG